MLAEATTLPHVTGSCPACGRSALVLSPAGEVTCTHLGCERPDTVARLLADPDQRSHIVDLGPATFSLRHPLAERLDDALHACPLHAWLQSLPGPPAAPGRYRASAADGALAWNLERIDDVPACA